MTQGAKAAKLALYLWILGCLITGGCRQAHAHASLLGSQPASGEVLANSPKQIVLHFNEPVGPIQLKVLDHAGRSVGVPGPVGGSGNDLILPLTAGLPDGAYVLSYRVVSADTHPVGGSFVFYVGTVPTGAPAGAQQSELDPWTYAVGLNRWALYTLMLLATGSALFVLLMRVPLEIEDRTSMVGRRSAILAGISYVLAIVLGGAQMLTGPAAIVFGPRTWITGAGTTLGSSAALGVPAMILLYFGFLSRNRPLLAVGGLGAIASFLLTGHAATAWPVWLMASMVAVHLACAAFWLGALYPLFCATRGRNPAETGSIMEKFSRRAVISVALLLASGVVITVVQLGTVNAFVTTQYGWRLILKLTLFLLLLALAAYNKRVLTPQIVAGDKMGSSKLGRSIRRECVLYVLILGAAASLTLTEPPRAIAKVVSRPEPHPYLGTVRNGGYSATVEVTPAIAGENMVMVTVKDAGGQAVRLESMELTVALPAAGVAEAETKGMRSGSMWHFDVTETIVPGTWTFRIGAYVNEFDKTEFELKVPIGKQEGIER